VLSVPENIIDYAADYLRILYLFAAGCGLITLDAKLDRIITREEADSICRNSKI